MFRRVRHNPPLEGGLTLPLSFGERVGSVDISPPSRFVPYPPPTIYFQLKLLANAAVFVLFGCPAVERDSPHSSLRPRSTRFRCFWETLQAARCRVDGGVCTLGAPRTALLLVGLNPGPPKV